MLYYLAIKYIDHFTILNVFTYITFRGLCAALTSLIIMFSTMNYFINLFKEIQNGGQPIREDGPASHLVTKKGTPTMGGLVMLLSVFASVFLWGDLTNQYLWLVLFVTFSFGALGFIDDFLKVTKKNTKGVRGKHKLIIQSVVSLIAYVWLQKLMPDNLATKLAFPMLKQFVIDIGYFYIPFIIVVTVGASNAVNLTDGLDGLAIVPVMIAALCFGIIAYVVGHSVFSDYLKLHHVPNCGEIAVFCASLVGAGLGFLWYNAPPAKIFMGDTGSLACGGSLGIISVITKHEIVLSIIGGLFVIEAASVIMQVYYYKLTKGKRIFLMAPLHHHFEKKGWSESTVVIRFWIISIIFAIIGMSTLKIR
ncbi:MAG: phospho-N-acetylmuramoyl-pentapeptide-transferase [Sphingobacteriia bacterium]|nr:phospho-N-acetylmuramoyl-pentapeptide-transferase [Sphingobacteriia bacterium]